MKKKACAVEKVKDPNNFASTIATNHSSRRVRWLLVDLIAIRYLFFSPRPHLEKKSKWYGARVRS